ncbi:MAG: ABC-2 family transporter protein [Candidatus Krumholzibacteriia bacterium]
MREPVSSRVQGEAVLAAAAVAGAARPTLVPWRRSRASSRALYFNFIRLAFLKYLAYRLRYYTGVLSYTIFVAGNYYLYTALYTSRSDLAETAGRVAEIGGLTLGEMITYVGLAWIGRSFYFNNIDRTLSYQVQQGEIAVHLIKPFHLQTVMMFEAVGEAGFRLMMFTVPIVAVIVPLFDIQGPAQPALLGWTVLSFALAFVINSQINFLVGCLAFYLKNINGVIRAKMISMDFLTGVMIPFTFFPEWVQSVLARLPFQYIGYVPVTIYLGKRTGPDLVEALLLQAAWGLGLFLAGRWVWNRSVRHVTLQGG